MSIVAGSSNNVYALDNDTGYVVWQRQFDAPLPAPTAACPGGITAAATRIVSVVPASGRAGGAAAGRRTRRRRLSQRASASRAGRADRDARRRSRPRGRTRRGARARGGTPAAGAAPPAAGGAPPAAGWRAAGGAAARPVAAAVAAVRRRRRGRAWRPRRQGGPAFPARRTAAVRAAASAVPPASSTRCRATACCTCSACRPAKTSSVRREFLPANARWSDAIAVNTTLYAATSGNCGGAPNAVWAIDLDSEAKPVVSWRTNGGSDRRRRGVHDATARSSRRSAPARRPATAKRTRSSRSIPKTLQLKDWFTQPTAEFVTGPTIFRHNDQDIVAAATRDGRVLLLDAASLGGANHATPLHASRPLVGAGALDRGRALATWQEIDVSRRRHRARQPARLPARRRRSTLGTRWILVPIVGPAAGATSKRRTARSRPARWSR